MAKSDDSQERPSAREIFEATVSGAQARPFIPRLRSDPPAYLSYHPLPQSLVEFREREGRAERKKLLRQIWKQLPRPEHYVPSAEKASLGGRTKLTPMKAEKLKLVYEEELLGSCGVYVEGNSGSPVNWKEFKEYAEAKEAELWDIFHNELDLDGNGHLDSEELATALSKAGITLSPPTLVDFMTHLAPSPHSHAISFEEFRRFLLLLPRKISAAEIYRFYEVHKYLGDDGRGAGRVTMEGDVTLSAEDHPPPFSFHKQPASQAAQLPVDHTAVDDDEYEDDDFGDEHEHHSLLDGHPAIKFLLAGGVAGAVSRTFTAPFDRLKIFLMTRPPDLGGTPLNTKPGLMGAKAIVNAVSRIYSEGGVLAFWTGNGLSVAKIFPESAIKFMTYESSKRAFAKYVDHVEDSRDISGTSRFLSGGMGGIASQLSIYPMETLKTQMMSSTGNQKRTLVAAVRHIWQLGGVRYFYRGLTIGLVGVFPYSAIDMSTFEALKLAYLRSTGKEEPGVLAILAFGSVSGSVGATSVYPLNLVRTRLQASGSSGHPQKYTGVWDVASQTYHRDGWRGFYRGLFPTLAKVVPAVSISYMVYEHTKRRLGV
ncbi:mitochondrial carrier [Athelia psychrophila]|uniref:Mitochondrial carrier n=1 Tax=Athelia psychrophila TaxID=1759441 RepID=A0A166VR98_9AGAM|nr:mitochondrial carrier [Fibularhizoctonia sp. CBS 109695]